MPPPGTVTDALPDTVEPTTAVIVVAETTENEDAAMPPILTVEAPVKLFPVIVTVAPEVAMVGENEAIDGAGNTLLLNNEILAEL